MIMTTISRRACLLMAVVSSLAAALPVYAGDEVIDSVMLTDPDIPAAQVVKVFPERLTSLWLQALEQPDNDLKRQAAATIALAHKRGMPGLEKTVSPLLRAFDQPEQHLTVRLAAAHALITLDARTAAKSLLAHAETDGIDMQNLVEPVLAKWDYKPARAVWLARLKQSELPGRGWVLAIQGLGVVREAEAVPRLRELLLSSATDPIIRLEAARSLGAIQTTDLEKEAEQLATEKAGPGNVAHIAAASLLRKHRSDESAKILQRLAVDPNPAAAAVALDGLLDRDPRLVLPLMRRLVASADPTVRAKAIEALRRSPQPDDIPLVAELMDDPHPQVRVSARKALLDVARGADHGDAVRHEATRLLATDRWRALEQATILLALLDHKPSAARFIELLRFPRPEVFVAAAWGLRKLAVAETLPDQLREIERRWQQSQKPPANHPHEMIDREVAQLAQALGQAKYKPAAPALARFVPKAWNIGPESRQAAIWALGLIHGKAAPAGLVAALIGRLTDESLTKPEDLDVRRMCAIALGRMKSEAAVDSLRTYYPRKLSLEALPNACGWALEQITGEKLPRSATVEVIQKGWFLEPNN